MITQSTTILRGMQRLVRNCFLLAWMIGSVSGIALAQQRGPNDIVGSWKGTYVCQQGSTGVTLAVQPPINGVSAATFSFYPTGGSGASGSYRARITYDPARRTLSLVPVAWISQPPGYSMVGFAANQSSDGHSFSGRINGGGCQGIQIARDHSGGTGTAAAPKPSGQATQAPTPPGRPPGQATPSQQQSVRPTQPSSPATPGPVPPPSMPPAATPRAANEGLGAQAPPAIREACRSVEVASASADCLRRTFSTTYEKSPNSNKFVTMIIMELAKPQREDACVHYAEALRADLNELSNRYGIRIRNDIGDCADLAKVFSAVAGSAPRFSQCRNTVISYESYFTCLKTDLDRLRSVQDSRHTLYKRLGSPGIIPGTRIEELYDSIGAWNPTNKQDSFDGTVSLKDEAIELTRHCTREGRILRATWFQTYYAYAVGAGISPARRPNASDYSSAMQQVTCDYIVRAAVQLGFLGEPALAEYHAGHEARLAAERARIEAEKATRCLPTRQPTADELTASVRRHLLNQTCTTEAAIRRLQQRNDEQARKQIAGFMSGALRVERTDQHCTFYSLGMTQSHTTFSVRNAECTSPSNGRARCDLRVQVSCSSPMPSGVHQMIACLGSEGVMPAASEVEFDANSCTWNATSATALR